jgi:hypothetical protein
VTSFFLDGSALAKRDVAEPGTPLLDHLFDHVAADRLFVLDVGLAEVVSILVRRKNAGTLSAARGYSAGATRCQLVFLPRNSQN